MDLEATVDFDGRGFCIEFHRLDFNGGFLLLGSGRSSLFLIRLIHGDACGNGSHEKGDSSKCV